MKLLKKGFVARPWTVEMALAPGMRTLDLPGKILFSFVKILQI